MKRKIIPDVYTEYDDGRLGVSGLGLANIEAKIGTAKGGIPGKLYVLAGSTGKNIAKKVFKGGPLLKAIEEAFDAGSSTIYAWRIGSSEYSEITIKDDNGTDVIKLKAKEPGTYWNKFDVQVTYAHDPPEPADEPVITIRDMNQNPETVWTFTAKTTKELVEKINEEQSEFEAKELGAGLPAALSVPKSFTGGDDGLTPENQDYLKGLELTYSNPEIAWIHAVEATDTVLWKAILSHCDEMLETYKSERFALLETEAFDSDNSPGSSGYIVDLQNYVDTLVAKMKKIADRNGVVFFGDAEFLGSDGEVYQNPLTAAGGGLMSSLEVHKSLINKQVKNVIRLIPEFTPGHLQQLIQSRVNPVRLQPGRGFIVSHSLTSAGKGSDFSRVNDLRSVYYAAKAARDAALIYVGEENDESGEGLRRLESAMSRPLDVMRDGGQIDGYKLQALSNQNHRLLGEVHVELGIKPKRAMEMIYMTVFLS